MKYLLTLAIGIVFICSSAHAQTYFASERQFELWNGSPDVQLTIDPQFKKITSSASLWGRGGPTEFNTVFVSNTSIVALSADRNILIEFNLSKMELTSGDKFQEEFYGYLRFGKYMTFQVSREIERKHRPPANSDTRPGERSAEECAKAAEHKRPLKGC